MFGFSKKNNIVFDTYSIDDLSLVKKYFDPDFYRTHNVTFSPGHDAELHHFMTIGWRDGFDPSRDFSIEYYLKTYPDIADSKINPFIHFLKYGGNENRIPNPYFSPQWIRSQIHGEYPENNPLLAFRQTKKPIGPRPIFDIPYMRAAMHLPDTTTASAVMDMYFATPPHERVEPNILFNSAYVRHSSNAPADADAVAIFLDLNLKGQNIRPFPLYDPDYIYLNHRWLFEDGDYLTIFEKALCSDRKTEIRFTPLFDMEYYLSQAGQSVKPGENPLAHYLRHGGFQGYEPNPWFDEKLYRERYLSSGPEMPGLLHYIQNGREPHITLSPRFPDKYYIGRYPEVLRYYDKTPLEHYIRHGQFEGRSIGTPFWHDDFVSWDQLREDVRSKVATLGYETPDVSVIIPVYNQFLFTLRCVWSLIKAQEKTRIQIIVADDGSNDETEQYFKSVPGLTYIRNPENLGFLRSCNNATKQATAPYIFFLNNDTAILPNAINALLETARAIPDAGLVGSKLVYPDGTLQEAGGYIWSDGTGENLGRYSDPAEPGYNFMRDCDYVSGAAILVPTAVWNDLGGFDDRYAPAYCEDADLAIRLRNLGWRVLYQPASVVVHFEGISSGRSTNSGIKSYQVTNQKKMKYKWEYVFELYLSNQTINPRKIPRPLKPKILYIDWIVPEPDKDAGSVIAKWHLTLLSQLGFDVTFVPHNLQLNGRYGLDLQKLGIEVIHEPYENSIYSYLDNHAVDFDLFWLVRYNMGGEFVEKLRQLAPQTKIVLNTADLHFLRQQREALLSGASEDLINQARQVKERELRVIDMVDETILVSQAENDMLVASGNPNSFSIIPLTMECRASVPIHSHRKDIAFIGGFQHTPNVDAVDYFIKNIWPLVHQEVPDICFHIIGSNPPKSILDIAYQNVIVHGYVEDLDPLLDSLLATVVPLQFGAGIKGKIGTSLAAGLPCISSEIGVEGMGLTDSDNVLVANSPQEYVNHIINLKNDANLWANISDNGLKFVRDNYSPERNKERLLSLMAKISAPPFKGKCPITGKFESRRLFSNDYSDLLTDGVNGSNVSERIITLALLRLLGINGRSLESIRIPIEIKVALFGEMPVLAKSLLKQTSIAELEDADVILSRIPLDNNYQCSLRTLLDRVAPHAQSIILACPDVGYLTKSHSDTPLKITSIIKELEEQGWEARHDKFAAKETSIARSALIEARRVR